MLSTQSLRTLALATSLTALGASTALAQCCGDEAKAPTETVSARDVVDTAVAAGSFKTLAKALGAADLVKALKGKGPFTVFAPTDAAFAKLPKATLASLLKPENKAQLTEILTLHVVAGKVDAKTALKLGKAKALNGETLEIELFEGSPQVNGAKITATDIMATNGVIHVIDTVLLPSKKAAPKQMDIVDTAVAAGSFKTLAKALGAADLVKALKGKGPFTVFAPTDAAFAKLPKATLAALLKPENKAKLTKILTLHVVAGKIDSKTALKVGKAKTLNGETLEITVTKGVARVNGAKLVKTDIMTSNGVIHVIDSVILPKPEVAMAPIHGLQVPNIDGQHVSLGDYKGKVVLIVNTASRCGYTSQYAGLEKLYKHYESRGLVVLGFPSNDFGGQEPGSEAQIKAFCATNYGVTFPMFAKVKTQGAHAAPLYKLLSESKGKVTWNFNKFLVGRDGQIIARFGSSTQPMNKDLTDSIEDALGPERSASAKRYFK